MNLAISAGNSMANIPNQNFLFQNIHLGSENPANKADKNQQAYSVTISKESLERLKKNPLLNTMNVEKQDQYRDILSKAQIDVTGTIELEFHHRYTSLNTETYHNDMKGDDFAKNAFSVYADMYDEIKRGYADGTREIYIADNSSEFGYRRATEEEEIAALDAAFDFHAAYTEAYMRFVDEDRDAMNAGIQKSQDLWRAARENRNQRAAEEQAQIRMENIRQKVENNKQPGLMDWMKQARNDLKVQYRAFEDNIPELLNQLLGKLYESGSTAL